MPKTPSQNARLDYTIDYANASIPQLKSVVDNAANCSYTFKYECHAVQMTKKLGVSAFNGTTYDNWWNNFAEGMCKGKWHL